MICSTASAAELYFLDLREFSFEGYKLADHRDSYLDYDEWRGGTAVNFDLDLAKAGDWGLVWDNRVEGNGTQAQFREVLWRYQIGLDTGPRLRWFWSHESRHVLDAARDDKFPLYNTYGLKVTFYERP